MIDFFEVFFDVGEVKLLIFFHLVCLVQNYNIKSFWVFIFIAQILACK